LKRLNDILWLVARKYRLVRSNLAEMLTSRNFDISGYWGMGVLYKLCLDNDKSLLTIDLGSETSAFGKDLIDPIRKPCWASLNQDRKSGG